MATDAFDRRYAMGVPDELPPPEPARGRSRGRSRAAPTEPFALKGCVITPQQKLENGYVLINGGGSGGGARGRESLRRFAREIMPTFSD